MKTDLCQIHSDLVFDANKFIIHLSFVYRVGLRCLIRNTNRKCTKVDVGVGGCCGKVPVGYFLRNIAIHNNPDVGVVKNTHRALLQS